MTQLIINGNELPAVTMDKYTAYKTPLGSSRRAISGRLITEKRGDIWTIEYSNDYIGNALMRVLLLAFDSRDDLVVQFLPNSGNDLITANFRCTKRPVPKVAFDRNGVALWHNVSFTLESVEAVN